MWGGHSKAVCCETKKFTTALKLQIILLSLLVTCAAALFCLPAKEAHAAYDANKGFTYHFDSCLWDDTETRKATVDGVTYTYEWYVREAVADTIYEPEAYITSIESSTVDSVVVPEKLDDAYVRGIGTADVADGICSIFGAHAGITCNIGANISSLDLSRCSQLLVFHSEGTNNLTTLRASGLEYLDALCCKNGKLSNLILSDLSLRFLDCSENNLSSLNIESLTSLHTLECQNNKISNTAALESWLSKDGHYGQVLPQKATSDSGNTGNIGNSGNAGNNGDNNTPATLTGAWKHNSKGWWYAYSNGTYAKGMKKIGNATYYFNNSGWMKTGWQHATGNSDWYYFNKSGAMKTGWLKSGGKWYYLNPTDGKMKTGFYNVGNTRYYSNGSGVMKTGWQKISNSWYYFASSGAMKTGWAKTSGKWYYLNSDGKMQTGKQVISGKTYFLNSSGAMRTGWFKSGSDWYYCNKSGAMQTSKWIGNYYVNADGKMLTNQWVKTDGKEYYVNKAGKWTGAKR